MRTHLADALAEVCGQPAGPRLPVRQRRDRKQDGDGDGSVRVLSQHVGQLEDACGDASLASRLTDPHTFKLIKYIAAQQSEHCRTPACMHAIALILKRQLWWPVRELIDQDGSGDPVFPADGADCAGNIET